MTSGNKISWIGEPDLAHLRRAHGMLSSNPAEALVQLKALADRGSVMSMVYLGDAYKFGHGTRIDLTEAENWYRHAANAGSVLAYYWLGRLYLKLMRYDEAREAFGFAAARDDMPAVYYLGWMHLYGRGVDRDLDKAKAYLEHAAAHRYVFAKRVLASLLVHNGQGLYQKLRGILLLGSAVIDFFVIICSDGLTSDRLR